MQIADNTKQAGLFLLLRCSLIYTKLVYFGRKNVIHLDKTNETTKFVVNRHFRFVKVLRTINPLKPESNYARKDLFRSR